MKIPKIFLTIILVAIFLFFASLLYRTVILIFILLIWRKPLAGLIPEKYRRRAMRAVWAALIILVWVALPLVANTLIAVAIKPRQTDKSYRSVEHRE